MADVILATAFLLGGFLWSALWLLAEMNDPTPGQHKFGTIFATGPVALITGIAYWAWLIHGWL